MKKYYGPIVLGIAALTVAAPIVNTTTVLADTNNSAITEGAHSEGDAALQVQYRRLEAEEDSGKYNTAQVLTLQTVEGKFMHKAFVASDNQKEQYAQELKDYLDKGVVEYSSDQWTYTYPINVNDQSDFVIFDMLAVYTFKAVNEPEIQHLEYDGYTIVDKNGNPSNGDIKMWLDDDYRLHVDPNYLDPKTDHVMVVKNGEKAKISSNPWTQQTNTVRTKHMALLYTLDGNQVKNRALAGNSAWYSDRYATINGQTMYRVATNEWVSANDLK